MTLPSYARATISSELRTSPRLSRFQELSSNKPNSPTRLKRPSTLSTETRRRILYEDNLYYISKKNAAQPCPLAELPSEIRTAIYVYVFGHRYFPTYLQINRGYQPVSGRWPCLLHICRAIRIEAAYTYYTTTPFYFNITNLDFSIVRRWVELLPVSHRALLAKNQHLTINIRPEMCRMYGYMRRDWSFDAPTKTQWRACQQFGNLFSLQGETARRGFILFCRLATWWLWCARPGYRNTRWIYTFYSSIHGKHDTYSIAPSMQSLYKFLRYDSLPLRLRCIARTWTAHTCEKDMAPEASSLLNALQNTFESFITEANQHSYQTRETKRILQHLRRVVAKWERGER